LITQRVVVRLNKVERLHDDENDLAQTRCRNEETMAFFTLPKLKDEAFIIILKYKSSNRKI